MIASLAVKLPVSQSLTHFGDEDDMIDISDKKCVALFIITQVVITSDRNVTFNKTFR